MKPPAIDKDMRVSDISISLRLLLRAHRTPMKASFIRSYKLVVIGAGGEPRRRRHLDLSSAASEGVGKSALTVKFVNNRFEERYDPTIEGMSLC